MIDVDETLKGYSGAWDGVSFTPERRFETFKNDLKTQILKIEEVAQAENVEGSYYINKLVNLACKFLASKSRCVSSMIAGGSKFPTERMAKRSEWALAWFGKYVNYSDYAIEKIKKRNVVKVSQKEMANEWTRKADKLEQLQEKMKLANKLIRTGKIEDLIELVGEVKAKELQTPDFCGRLGYPDYELRNNLANIKRLRKQAEQVERMQARNVDEYSFKFNGGNVEYNAEEIRYNIYFDDIPEEGLRSKLKRYGFKWSPKRKAWTRGAKTIRLDEIKYILGV